MCPAAAAAVGEGAAGAHPAHPPAQEEEAGPSAHHPGHQRSGNGMGGCPHHPSCHVRDHPCPCRRPAAAAGCCCRCVLAPRRRRPAAVGPHRRCRCAGRPSRPHSCSAAVVAETVADRQTAGAAGRNRSQGGVCNEGSWHTLLEDGHTSEGRNPVLKSRMLSAISVCCRSQMPGRRLAPQQKHT